MMEKFVDANNSDDVCPGYRDRIATSHDTQVTSSEIVSVDMAADARLTLYAYITSQMEKRGLNPMDWGELDLGFELPAGWPVDVGSLPTMAQLIVIAVKLEMRIVITNLVMLPRKAHE